MSPQDYPRALAEGYERTSGDDGEMSRLAYLCDYIFNLTTYDAGLSELLARRALEVCVAITNRTTFDYIKDPDLYIWYVMMCNMPFFEKRLNWGTSIRGAWWDTSAPKASALDSCGLWLDGEQITDPIKFSTDQWVEFIAAVVAFSKGAA